MRSARSVARWLDVASNPIMPNIKALMDRTPISTIQGRSESVVVRNKRPSRNSRTLQARTASESPAPSTMQISIVPIAFALGFHRLKATFFPT